MEQEPDWAAGDPEIAALLSFTPVPRKIVRPDGWDAARQRGFIAWVAAGGNAIAAATAVGRSLSGARQIRREDALGEFTAAWTGAVALYDSRHTPAGPPRPQAPPPQDHAPRPAPASEAAPDEMEEAEQQELLDEIFRRYAVKLEAERASRLEGRIVEADFYARQLSFIELVLDIGGRAQELLHFLSWDGLHLLQVSATPGSVLLEKARRAFWLEKGEADRPPPAPLGRHNERFATGEDDYDPVRDGTRKEWELRQKEKHRLAAEAQAEWEARARAEAERRGKGGGGDAGAPAP